MNIIIKSLVRIGLVRIKDDGKVRWPVHVPPGHHFKTYNGRIACGWRAWGRMTNWKPYVFRNLPGVIKWEPGRLLPRRWGFGWAGFEFGDRG